jgi:hypothetical protein
MRRYSQSILITLLAFLIGIGTPALWEVVSYYGKEWRKSWRPVNLNHCYIEESKEPQLIDLAAPLPSNQQKGQPYRRPQSNNGMQRTRR